MPLLMPLGPNIGKIIYFPDSKPCVEPISFFVLDWRTLVLMPFRPYYAGMNSAFCRVFERLGLPWIDQKSRTTAALLAVFLGLFGLHHFYLGNKRRGMYYLGFFWTMVPLFLSWVDAVRLALTEEEEFQRKFNA
jgi:TM2 domain-containing membrane protein YozV